MFDSKAATLLAVVNCGSYTKAAAALSLTQPAVSHHIRQLEEEFGVQIFYKDKRELKLTPEGAVLVKYARRAMAIYHNAIQAIADSKSKIKHFVVALTPTAGENLVPQTIAVYCNENPEIHINIFTDAIKNIYDKLKSYEADIAIVEGRISDPSFTTLLLDTDYLCLAVSPQHPFAGRGSVSLHELKGERFILRSKAANTRVLFENYLQNQSKSIRDFNVMMEIDNVATIKELVSQNLGITIIAHSACREEEQTGKLSVVPIENSSMVREINMVVHRDFNHIEVLEELRQIYNSLKNGRPWA